MTIPRWIGLAGVLALLVTLAGILVTCSTDRDATIADAGPFTTHTTRTETSPGAEDRGPGAADGRDDRAASRDRGGATGHGTDGGRSDGASTGARRQSTENDGPRGRGGGADGSRDQSSDDSAAPPRGDGEGTRRGDTAGGSGRDGARNDTSPDPSRGDGGADRDGAGSGDQASGDGAGGTGDGGGSGSTTAINEVELGPPLVDPKGIHFGFVAVGDSRALQITLRNSDPRETRSIIAIDIRDETQEFFLTENNCPPGARLVPGARCTLLVTFTPSARGAHHGQLVITEAKHGTRHVPLTGTTTLGGTGPEPAPEPEPGSQRPPQGRMLST